MNKLDFFLAAMQAEEFRRRAWVISAFSLIREGPDDWKQNPYPYRIVQGLTGHFYVNPQNTQELLPIEGATLAEAPFNKADKIILQSGIAVGVNKDIETTFGNLLAHFVTCVYPFNGKIPFIQGRYSPAMLEAQILPRLQDDPLPLLPGDPTPPTPKTALEAAPIYVHEYLKFANAMFYLAGFAQLWVPATTAKTMTQAPGIVELRTKLLAENKDRLHDPAIIAAIQAQLIAYDRAYIKGDLGEGFLITGKSFNTVRSKLFGMHGAETGLKESVDVELITRSLSEGWDIDKFPAMNNSQRAGSFSRGALTMLGGESVKWLLRASSNLAVTQDDCGSKVGNDFTADGTNYPWLTGFSVITPQGPKQVVSDEDAKSYIGKKVQVRSAMYCQLPKTDMCKVCVGARLAANPTALSTAIADYGSAFLGVFMAAAHAKQLTTHKLDYKTAIQ